MIFVVCKYKRHCKDGFKAFIDRHPAVKVDENSLIMQLAGTEIQLKFILDDEYRYDFSDPNNMVIFWGGTSIEELEYEISRTIRLLI